jgi:hypothetical protein
MIMGFEYVRTWICQDLDLSGFGSLAIRLSQDLDPSGFGSLSISILNSWGDPVMGMITRIMTSMIKGLGMSAFLSINIWGLGYMVLTSLMDTYGQILVL